MEAVLPATYARWRTTRLGTVTERIERDLVLDLAGPVAGRHVLDVGCGDGTYAIACAKRGAQVTGVDVSEPMLEAARGRALEHGVRLRLEKGSATSLPFADGTFGLVLAVTVLCFVDDEVTAMREMARVLAPGGRLVLGELNRWSVWAAWRRIRGWRGSRTWRKARFHSARELSQLATTAGLQVSRVAGAVYYPPLGALAHLMEPMDPIVRTITPVGAAFIAVAATRRTPRQGAHVAAGAKGMEYES